MNMQDWIRVGLKLLAVYFGAIGLIMGIEMVASNVIQGMFSVANEFEPLPWEPYNLFSLLRPFLYLVASYVLARKTGYVFDYLKLRPKPTNDTLQPLVTSKDDIAT